MIFKSRSKSPLMRAVRETFDKFDMGPQAELRIFCREEEVKEESAKGEKAKEESVLPVARSLLLTSSPFLRFSFLTITSSPMTIFITLLDLMFLQKSPTGLSSPPSPPPTPSPCRTPPPPRSKQSNPNKKTVILTHDKEQINFYTLTRKISDADKTVTKIPAYMLHPSFSKVSEVLKLLGSKWEEVLIDNQHIDILTR